MFSAFLALAFSVAVCVHLTVGFDGFAALVRDAYRQVSEWFRRASERSRDVLARAARRRSAQEG